MATCTHIVIKDHPLVQTFRGNKSALDGWNFSAKLLLAPAQALLAVCLREYKTFKGECIYKIVRKGLKGIIAPKVHGDDINSSYIPYNFTIMYLIGITL